MERIQTTFLLEAGLVHRAIWISVRRPKSFVCYSNNCISISIYLFIFIESVVVDGEEGIMFARSNDRSTGSDDVRGTCFILVLFVVIIIIVLYISIYIFQRREVFLVLY